MNALEHMLATVHAAHTGQPLPKAAACKPAKAMRPAKKAPQAPDIEARQPQAARPAKKAPQAPETAPAIARALDVLRAAIKPHQGA